MIDLATHDAVIAARVTMGSTEPVEALWTMAWRTRSAQWMLRNRGLEMALGRSTPDAYQRRLL